MESVLVGRTVKAAEFIDDEIMMFGVPAEAFRAAVEKQVVSATGRKGKYWWLEFAGGSFLVGHLGMSGWIREYGTPTIRLREHGQAPLEDETGRPRFLKMKLTTDESRSVVFTDGRRLGRLWLSSNPLTDPRIAKLGPDVYTELPTPGELHEILRKRKAPLKALLLDQGLFAGVGNWIADEVLYAAKLSPKRLGESLSLKESIALYNAIQYVVGVAVEVDADKDRFPSDWLFHARWGGKFGQEIWQGESILREPVGGRTTAWVPTRQK